MHTPRPRHGRRRAPFHGGSFVAGMVLGIALTLTGALLPDLLDDAPDVAGAKKKSEDAAEAKPAVAPKFEFFDSLPKTGVATDPRPYETATPRPRATTERVEYLLQAGSFSNPVDADNLRESLRALGLPANTVQARLADGVERHRVIVGPFAGQTEVERARTKLRERNIDALLLARKPAAG